MFLQDQAGSTAKKHTLSAAGFGYDWWYRHQLAPCPGTGRIQDDLRRWTMK